MENHRALPVPAEAALRALRIYRHGQDAVSGVAGHNLCMDFFGSPSEEEARQGLSIHGEAPSLRWHKARAGVRRREVRLKLALPLPVAQLRFERELTLRRGESVAYFRETVKNLTKADHFFHWTQHVTLGPPFLNSQASSVWILARKGRTYPHGYEGKELLESSRDFKWPSAPGVRGKPIAAKDKSAWRKEKEDWLIFLGHKSQPM